MEELGAEMCVGSQVFQDPLLSMHMIFLMLLYSFSINLGCSSRDLAFHFNPRFNESVIVCNSKCSDSWQTELRDRHLPFFRGCTVKFFIEMLSDKFRVKLPDGHEVCFPNRHGHRNISYVSIVGGLKIISFKLT
ncbi:galectin-2 isoform X1 [Ammospiza nelsoni]|uniref:galectin-2 isoform X1 n=1 Tax=Ammospiza caudacuta TaxID=2857398 RepID=UPI002739658C|nr:galectin-2 isoform X1 [Ammospiza caudacuta]XP_059329129.1 galectin-2 isoform X1 [Ammospiza nelsoni]